MTTTERRPQTASDDQRTVDTHGTRVVAGPNVLADQKPADAHSTCVGEDPNSVTTGHAQDDTHTGYVGGDGPTPPGSATTQPEPKYAAPILADPLLALAADIVDDLERVRMATANRLGQLTRSTQDKDGGERGFELSLDDPNVQSIVSIVATLNCQAKVLKDLGWERPPKKRGELCCLEHEAEKNLTTLLRTHPLQPWITGQLGVGDKQGARLLATIGDPCIRPNIFKKNEDGEPYLAEPSRPRLVSELWSYCGYGDAQEQVRRKGKRSNWSPGAKMRAFNIIDSCIKQVVKPCSVVYGPKSKGQLKGAYLYAVHDQDCGCSPYRVIYDLGRARYLDSVHPRECAQCGPKGKPAPVGSPRSPKHQHQCAVRLATKEFLRDLWREAARLHGHPGDQEWDDAHSPFVAEASFSSGDQIRADTHTACVAGGPTSLLHDQEMPGNTGD